MYLRALYTSNNSEPVLSSLIQAPSAIIVGEFAWHGIAGLTDGNQGYCNGYDYDPSALDDLWLSWSCIGHRRIGIR